MTNIQFYIIETDDLAERVSYALQLSLRQLSLGKHLHIHTGSAGATREILEQFASQLGNGIDKLSVDHQGEPGNEREVLLNLADEVPHFFSSFESTLEIICAGDASSEMGRERYRYYQSRGYPLLHSKVPSQLAL